MQQEAKDILVVDDETSVVEVVTLYLQREGFRVRQAFDGRSALQEMDVRMPDLVVLDVMLPQVDGLAIMKQLRAQKESSVPVIMLTARSQESDRVSGLEMGADDYVTKPFSPAELVARVKAVLRRTASSAKLENEEERLIFDGLEIDPKTRLVSVKGVDHELTVTEFNLLWYMARHPRQVFSRRQLLQAVWGFSEFVDPSTVTVHMRRLREKIEDNPGEPRWLVTVWGVGYRFEVGNG